MILSRVIYLNVYEVASFSADHIIIIDKPENLFQRKLLDRSGILKNKDKISVIKYSNDELPDFVDIANQLDIVIKKL